MKRKAERITEKEVEEILNLPDKLKKVPENDLFCVRLRSENYLWAKNKAKEDGKTPSEIIDKAIKTYRSQIEKK